MAQIITASYKLVTLHPDNELAKYLVERVTKDQEVGYDIEYLANCQKIEDLEATLKEHNPDIFFVASVWTPLESSKAVAIAETTVPGIKAHAIPHGLHKAQGAEAIVSHAKGVLPQLLG